MGVALALQFFIVCHTRFTIIFAMRSALCVSLDIALTVSMGYIQRTPSPDISRIAVARPRRWACHLATAGCWVRGVPERYVAGADTRGRQEGRPYPWSQQVTHEISGLASLLDTNRTLFLKKALHNETEFEALYST